MEEHIHSHEYYKNAILPKSYCNYAFNYYFILVIMIKIFLLKFQAKLKNLTYRYTYSVHLQPTPTPQLTTSYLLTTRVDFMPA